MDLSGKKVAVYGLGVSGLGAIEFLANLKNIEEVTVVNRGAPSSWAPLPKLESEIKKFDESDPEVSNQLEKVDLVILSPGIPREAAPLKKALLKGIPVWNEIELASHFFNGPVIAITGTNGKTTSVSFLDKILRELGLKVFTGGNIGTPFLKGLSSGDDFDVVLLEMSSFQCESLSSFRPDIASILNIFPNHGERYSSVENYRLAKWKMINRQSEEDSLFIGEGVGVAPPDFKGKLIDLQESWESLFLEDFKDFEGPLVGVHNRKNISFCWQILKAFNERFLKVPKASLVDTFKTSMKSFAGVEHRCEFVGQWQNYRVYNDAKSTNWQATLMAINAVKELGLPITLVIGGSLRGNNDLPPAEVFEVVKNLRVFTIGEAGTFFREKKLEFNFIENLQNLKVKLEASASTEDRVLLLSPAFPSFDQFQNYAERGRVFKSLFNR